MGGPFGFFSQQLGMQNPGGETAADLEAQIRKLSGRSQAYNALSELNVPLTPSDPDAIAALNQLSSRPRNYPGKSLVPYNRGSIVQAGGGAGDIVPFQGATGNALAPIQAEVAGTAGLPGQRALTAGPGYLTGGYASGPLGAAPPPQLALGAASRTAGGIGMSPFAQAGQTGSGILNALRGNSFFGRAIGPAAAESGIGRFLAPGALNAGGKFAFGQAALKGLGYAGAGAAAAQGINAVVPGNPHYQRTLSNAAVGAGIGAAIAAPTVIGTPVGALIGGIIGAGTSLFGNKQGPQTDKSVEKFNQAVNSSSLSEEGKANVLQTYNTLYQLAETKEEKQAAYAQASQTLLQTLQSDQQLQTDQKTMLASQAMLQNFLGPQMQNIVGTAQNQQGLLNQLSGNLPKEFQGVARLTAGQNVASANRIAAAYGNQMISQPGMMAIQLANQRAAQTPAGGDTAGLQALLSGG